MNNNADLLKIVRNKRVKWVCANCGRTHPDNIFYCQCGDTEKIELAKELDLEKEYLCLEYNVRFLFAYGSWRCYTLSGDLFDHGLTMRDVVNYGVIEMEQYNHAKKILGHIASLYIDATQLSLFED